MTTDELLALPEDGVERWLIRGELRENFRFDDRLMPPDHARVLSAICCLLGSWNSRLPAPRGACYARCWFRLRRDRDTLVAINAAYISAELRAKTSNGQQFVDSVPILAVEILSPSDVHSDVTEKVHEYLDVGVALVWVIDPDFETVAVYRPDAEPVFFNKHQEIAAEPHLQGFRVKVAELFE